MANFFVSYDLNGALPTHAQMDAHIKKSGLDHARVLETVWYMGGDSTQERLFDYLNQVLSKNDRLLVIAAEDAKLKNLLVRTESLQQAWARNK